MKEETIENLHKILLKATSDQMEYVKNDRATQGVFDFYDV
jgi:hypothetical protein